MATPLAAQVEDVSQQGEQPNPAADSKRARGAAQWWV